MTASEEVVKACRENGFKVVIKPPVHFAEIGMQLPFGRAFSSGKAILPAISRSLHDTLVAAEKLIPQFSDAAAAGIEPRHLNNPTGLPDSEAIAASAGLPDLAGRLAKRRCGRSRFDNGRGRVGLGGKQL